MKSVKEHMDMQDAYREVGSYRSAGIICGVSAETVKQSVLAAANPDGGRRVLPVSARDGSVALC